MFSIICNEEDFLIIKIKDNLYALDGAGKRRVKLVNTIRADDYDPSELNDAINQVACLIIISMVFTACMCIPEVREAMWDAFVTWYDDHIHVYFAEENPDETNNGEVDSDDLPITIPDNIEKKAIATYLPKGYYAEENESIALYVDTFYYDAEGNMKFRLLQRVIDEETDSDIMIDNENDPVTTMYVNCNEGILVEYLDVPGLYYLVWQDSYYQYSLYGSFSSVAELMKIAEGIKTE